ncbi:unnamed protein product, partial [marine sediment metagenome]
LNAIAKARKSEMDRMDVKIKSLETELKCSLDDSAKVDVIAKERKSEIGRLDDEIESLKSDLKH